MKIASSLFDILLPKSMDLSSLLEKKKQHQRWRYASFSMEEEEEEKPSASSIAAPSTETEHMGSCHSPFWEVGRW
jgi:hypothetical protein